MFIYSLKASTVKFVAVLSIALVMLITLIAFIPARDDSVSASTQIDYSGLKTGDDRIAFIGQFGWQVKPEAVACVEVRIPEEFDKVMSAYNEIQKGQGLDLSKYKGKTVQRYTYEVTNYDGYNGVVFVNIIVYRNKVIAGDVCSADISGFMHGLERTSQ